MCQDNLKIRDEDDLENGSMENVLKQPLIVRKVLESLDFPTLVQCRTVSKSWGKEATFIMAKKCKITFKSVTSVQEFLDLPSNTETLFVHVIFKFEVESEAKSAPVQTFLKIHGRQLTSVETPVGSVSGPETVQEWADKLLSVGSPGAPAILNGSVEEIKVDDASSPASSPIIDENANYMQLPDPSDDTLQEIVISDDIDFEDSKPKLVMTESCVSTLRKPKSVHFAMVENPDYVPIPYNDEGYENFEEFYPYYLGEHSNPAGRRLHVLGVTNTIILIIIGTFTLTPVLYAVAIVQAYALAIGAHFYFDKHIPKPTIKNPIYMVMGNLRMWWEVASGQRAL